MPEHRGRPMRPIAAAVLVAAAMAAGSAAAEETVVAWSVPEAALIDLLGVYDRAVRDAAVKRPSFEKPLTPIDRQRPAVRVVAFRWTGGGDVIGGNGRVTEPLWVSLPKEIKAACLGARDPVLALQQILGLPPRTGDYEMISFAVAPRHVFRPCASGPEIGTTSCSFTLPSDPATAARAKADPAFAATQQFVFQQMWSSYTYKVHSFGYPFTAMGWSYDWNPEAEDTYGISEYIVRQGAPVTGVKRISPKAFCR